MTDYRAEFDAEVTFLNGGGLQAQGSRLDIRGPDVSESELAAAFVRQLGLLMTDQVRLSAVRILQEPHKGLRGRPEPATTGRRGRMVEPSHVVTAGMVTYPGLPGPESDVLALRKSLALNELPERRQLLLLGRKRLGVHSPPRGSGAATPGGALRAMDATACPRFWRTCGPRRLRQHLIRPDGPPRVMHGAALWAE